MKRFALLLVAGVLVLVVAPVRSAVHRPPSSHVDEMPLWSGAGEAESPQSMLDLASSVNGPVTEAQVKRASAQAAALPEAKSTRWQFVGPTNVGGRVIDIAVDPTTTPSTVFAAVSSGGGIMKSTDGGVTFTPSYPDDFTQSMGALARGSDGTLYAGTGEGSNPSGGGSTFMGDGIYRSTDNGDTWQFSGLPDSGAFGRIVVNPDNPKEVWAAASGSLTWVSSQRGLYHSLDGGKTWDRALSGPGDHTGAVDIALQPGNPHVILASLWDRYRNNGSFYYGGAGSGLYRSTDDGKTWTRQDNSNINGAVCAWDKTKTGLNASEDLGHIGMAFAPSDPNRAYLVFATSNGPDKGYYVSNDAGQTWTCGDGEPGSTTGGYEWVFSRLWVDPANRDHVFEANVEPEGLEQRGRTRGATRAAPIPTCTRWRGTRRRRASSTSAATAASTGRPPAADSRTWTHAVSEPWVQPYHISVSQQDPKRLAIGLQDNGSVRTLDIGSRADRPDAVELLRRRRRLPGADRPDQPTAALPVLAADAAADQLRPARGRGGGRLDDQHVDELHDAAVAARTRASRWRCRWCSTRPIPTTSMSPARRSPARATASSTRGR